MAAARRHRSAIPRQLDEASARSDDPLDRLGCDVGVTAGLATAYRATALLAADPSTGSAHNAWLGLGTCDGKKIDRGQVDGGQDLVETPGHDCPPHSEPATSWSATAWDVAVFAPMLRVRPLPP